MGHAPQIWMCFILTNVSKVLPEETWREKTIVSIYWELVGIRCCPEIFTYNRLYYHCLPFTVKGNCDMELLSSPPKLVSGRAGIGTQAIWLQSHYSLCYAASSKWWLTFPFLIQWIKTSPLIRTNLSCIPFPLRWINLLIKPIIKAPP